MLNAVTAVLSTCLPEREQHRPLLDSLIALLDMVDQGDEDVLHWGPLLIRWELGVLSELGFGLDLSCCAATGVTEDLIYVSPRSGRAVSATAGKPYHDKLLPLPAFLVGNGQNVTIEDVRDGLNLTEFFLERYMFGPHGRKIPHSRRRLMDYVA